MVALASPDLQQGPEFECPRAGGNRFETRVGQERGCFGETEQVYLNDLMERPAGPVSGWQVSDGVCLKMGGYKVGPYLGGESWRAVNTRGTSTHLQGDPFYRWHRGWEKEPRRWGVCWGRWGRQ